MRISTALRRAMASQDDGSVWIVNRILLGSGLDLPKSYTSEGWSDVVYEKFPTLSREIAYPIGNVLLYSSDPDGEDGTSPLNVFDLIAMLKDHENWSHEEIAKWLEKNQL